jgi:alkylation response protein AidB-like acyl-CoA dehydrogenase
MAPDEGNMYLLGKVASPAQKTHFLKPLVLGEARSAFFMTEPAEDGGAGSDPSMMQTTGGHAVVTIDDLRVPSEQMLGASGEGFQYAQVRLSPARLSHCMRWRGSATRAEEIATGYA